MDEKEALKKIRDEYLIKKVNFRIELELFKDKKEDMVIATQTVKKGGLLAKDTQRNVTVADRRRWIGEQIVSLDNIIDTIDKMKVIFRTSSKIDKPVSI